MPNKSIKLTTAAILKLKPAEDRYEVSDKATNNPRLRLVVGASGCKTFAMRFRGVYRQSNLTLGQFDPLAVETDTAPVIGQRLSLQMARRLALDVHRQRALGIDTAG